MVPTRINRQKCIHSHFLLIWALFANVGCIAEARHSSLINAMDLLPAQPKPIPPDSWEATYPSLKMKTNDMRNSKSEYQTIFIVYSSKRPQIMYKSVEKQITWQDLGPVLRTLACVSQRLSRRLRFLKNGSRGLWRQLCSYFVRPERQNHVVEASLKEQSDRCNMSLYNT